MVPPVGSVLWGRAQNWNHGLSLHLSGKSCPPPAHALIQDYSVPPCMSLVPQCWNSEWVSLSKSIWGLFKRNAWDFRSPLSHSATIWAGFYSQKLWGLLFLPLWAGAPAVGLGPLAPQGRSLRLRYPSWFLFTTCGCWTSLSWVSAPPTSLDVAVSLYP